MARTFAGGTSTDKVSLPTDPGNTGTLSVSIWARQTSDATGFLVGKWANIATDAGSDWCIYSDPATDIWLFAARFGGDASFWSVPRPSLSVWHHLGVGFDGSSSANDPDVYIDGVLTAETSAYRPGGTRSSIAAAITIGNKGTANECFPGDLGEHALWSRKLDAAEWAMLGKGASALFFPRGRLRYTPMIQGINDLVVPGNTMTGTVRAPTHPRIYYPPPKFGRGMRRTPGPIGIRA